MNKLPVSASRQDALSVAFWVGQAAVGQERSPICGHSRLRYRARMDDGYNGLGSGDRKGCLFAALAGIVALIIDCARFFGDPAPGTEDLWWRHIPFLLPTIIVVFATFMAVRAISRRADR